MTGTSARITDLDANTRCKFKVETYDTVNGKDQKQSSTKTYTFKTEKEKLPAPSNYKVTRVNVDGMRMAWKDIPDADAYLVWYRKKGTKKWLPVKNDKKENDYIQEIPHSTSAG